MSHLVSNIYAYVIIDIFLPKFRVFHHTHFNIAVNNVCFMTV